MDLLHLASTALLLIALLLEHRHRIKDEKETVKILCRLQGALELLLGENQRLEQILRKKAGLIEKALTQGRVSEKLAQRAHSMASSTSVSVAILQRAIGAKTMPNRERVQKNNLTLAQLSKAKESSESSEEFFELLEPTLSEDERQILSDIRRNTNGVHK